MTGGRAQGSLGRATWSASLVLFGILPAVALALLFVDAVRSDAVAFDFRVFYFAAESVLDGESPYAATQGSVLGEYVYPPLTALVTVPLTVLSVEPAGILVMALLALAALATLHVLGVRDWRCYGIVLLWPPVISAIQTGNLTLWLALMSAVAWRLRDRPFASASSVGLALAAKLFLWPLVVWLAATRRLRAAALSCVVGAGLLLLSWAVIGFSGLTDYPDLVRRLEETVGDDSYTALVVAVDLGLPSAAARAVWLAVGLGLLAGVVALARRGDERTSFVLAIAAALALTPIVWLHYFALLVVVVAVAQPTLGIAWFVPLVMYVTPGSGHPTPLETVVTLAVAVVTLTLCVRASSPRRQRPELTGAPAGAV